LGAEFDGRRDKAGGPAEGVSRLYSFWRTLEIQVKKKPA
jgi:hypothetical protein